MSDLFQERETLFVDVIVPLAIPNLYTYRIPFELNPYVKIGQRVVVPFGKKKLYTSIVANVHSQPPSYTTKYIDFILDESCNFNHDSSKSTSGSFETSFDDSCYFMQQVKQVLRFANGTIACLWDWVGILHYSFTSSKSDSKEEHLISIVHH